MSRYLRGKFTLIDDWRRAHKFRSIQLAIFWGAVNGAVLALYVFSGAINPWVFLGLNVAGYASIGWARVTKQPGLD